MSANVEGRILHDPEKRVIRGRDMEVSYSCHTGTKSGVHQIYFPEDFIEDIVKGKYVVLSDVVSSGENCRLMNGRSITDYLDVDEDKIKDFLNPPRLSVGDALSSPVKRKLSVVGYAYKILDGDRRKFVKLSPNKVPSPEDVTLSVDVKLWGESAKDLSVKIGSKICITNVTVGSYQGKKDLNSTILTNLLSCEEEEQYQILVKAIKWKRPSSVILSDGNETFEVDTIMMEKTCGVEFGKLSIIGKILKGKRQGSKILVKLSKNTKNFDFVSLQGRYDRVKRLKDGDNKDPFAYLIYITSYIAFI